MRWEGTAQKLQMMRRDALPTTLRDANVREVGRNEWADLFRQPAYCFFLWGIEVDLHVHSRLCLYFSLLFSGLRSHVVSHSASVVALLLAVAAGGHRPDHCKKPKTGITTLALSTTPT